MNIDFNQSVIWVFFFLISVMTWDKTQLKLFCCVPESGHDVVELKKADTAWELERTVSANDVPLLQLHTTYDENHLIGSFMMGFKVSNQGVKLKRALNTQISAPIFVQTVILIG